MGIEVLDGVVEAAAVKRSSGKLTIYDSLTIRLKDGGERRLDKVAAAPAVAEALQPGVEGRFYGYKAIDHRGMIGVRTRDGRAAFAIPSGNERIMLMLAIAGLAWFLIAFFARDSITFLGLIGGVLGAIGYVRYRKTRIEGRALYDADAGYA